jgi:LysR family transcriptional regulator, regulator of abg operon
MALRLSQVRDFVAAVDHGSLRAAARRVGMSQPAMSKSLRQLEEELHTRLLVRSARGVALTPAGRAFLARARVIQAELRRVDEDLNALRGAGGGSVAIGIAPPLSLFMPEAMARFRQKYPAAQVRIVEGVRAALLPAVRDETLDFSVGQNAGGAPESGLRFKPLLRPQLVVAGRKGHPLAHARTLRELAGASWLVFNPLGAGGMLERAFAGAGIAAPKALVLCESYATALALLAQSDVLGLLFDRLFAEPLASRFLHRFALEETIAAPSLGMFLRADTPLAPAAAAMAQALSVTMRSLVRRPA